MATTLGDESLLTASGIHSTRGMKRYPIFGRVSTKVGFSAESSMPAAELFHGSIDTMLEVNKGVFRPEEQPSGFRG